MPEDAYKLLGLERGTPFVVVRFVAWQAYHDEGYSGITIENKIKLIREIAKCVNVYISAEENSLPADLEKYRIRIPSEMMHIVMREAVLFIGEGGTMVSESAMLGTPAIYVCDIWPGSTNEEHKYGLLHRFKADEMSQKAAILKALELLNDKDIKSKTLKKRDIFLKDHIDPTAFLVWFIENYPMSKQIMKENSVYQFNFR